MPTISTMTAREQHINSDVILHKDDASKQQTYNMANPSASLLIVMVGLPLSGKSHLARRMHRRLNWLGHNTTVITAKDSSSELSSALEAKSRLQENCDVILDGCYSKTSTRRKLSELCADVGARILFVSCTCADTALLNANMMEALNFRHGHKTPEEALGELRTFFEDSKLRYEPITRVEGRLIEVTWTAQGPSVLSNNINGYREKEILSIACSKMPSKRTYYFSRHGESEYNVIGRIGGDSSLSERGFRYACLLAKHAATAVSPPLKAVWTSRLKRTGQTARDVCVTGGHHRLAALDEIHAGVCEGMTYEEIQETYPLEFAMRDQDKLNYRYPRGESYTDVITRVAPILEELESTSDVLVVSHQAVLRVVLGYFLDKDSDELPYQQVPLHTVIRITNHGYLYKAEFVPLNVDCVDTNRKRPKNCSINRTTNDALNTVPSHLDNLQTWSGATQTV